MSDQLQSLLRTALQFGAGFLIKKGVGDSATWEVIIGAIISAAGLFLSWRNAQQKTTLKEAVAGDIALDHPDVKAIVPEPQPVAKLNEAPMVSPVTNKPPTP